MGSISLDIASSMDTRIRFVTCPTCREILPELPEIPLYKCGRCATILRAKNCDFGRRVSETNPTKKHGNSCRATGKDEGNDFVVDPCSTSEKSHRNGKRPAEVEHTKGDETIYLPRENNRKSPDEFQGQISRLCPNTESAEGVFPITVVEGHTVERSPVMERKNKVLDDDNASPLEGYLSLEEEDETEATTGTLNRTMLTDSLPKDNKYFKETQKKLPNFGPPGSEEILGSLPNNPRSPIGLVSKSPTKTRDASDANFSKGTDDISANRPSLKYRLWFKKLREGNVNSDTGRMAYMTRISQLRHENGSPSSIRPNVSKQYLEPHLATSTFYDDPDKMELLSKVYELKEMLNKTHISKKMKNRKSHARVLGEGKHIPHHYDNLATVPNAYANVKHSGHNGNHSQALRYTHQPKISTVEFSGEATQRRDRMDRVCSCCCHQCWHHTTKSCSHCIFSQPAIRPRNNYDNGYPSYFRSPQTHSSNKLFSQVLERKADDQLSKKKNMRRLCLREKSQTVRRHFRPLAGGAPIISCHYCSELLQLPPEHTFFNRRFYQLWCYSCERIMKLSLEKKVHLVPYLPTISAPPPSEIDDVNNN